MEPIKGMLPDSSIISKGFGGFLDILIVVT